jgi:hypothetical protein
MARLNKVKYINIRYLLNSLCQSNILNNDSLAEIKESLNKIILTDISLVILDINRVRFNTIEFNVESPKKSVLYDVFNDFLSKEGVDFLFVNGSEEASLHLIEKDFPKKENVFVLTFIPDYYFIHSITADIPNLADLAKRWDFLKSIDFIKSMKSCQSFIEKLISQKIKGFLLKHKCIQPIDIKDHILRSTPVHVNKYINIKPLIENYDTFDEVCFYLSDRIVEKFCTPHFLIAPSKNAISLASGILKYLKTSDIIVVNQVSPITAFNNYSNIEAIIPSARYAIIEDFHCMGTEIKVIKGILWSHGVNYQDDVYSFPVASTRIYDNDYPGGAIGQNIYPLYKLEKELNYKMFTNNTCPVCNEISGCEHRKLFDF